MKKFLTYVCLGAILLSCIFAAVSMGQLPRTYDPELVTVPVYELQQSGGENYDDSSADGAAAAIVQQNLAKTHAVNDVTSIVFDFRGYDTMGEAFILITAVAGSIVILSNAKKKEAAEESKAKEAADIILSCGCDAVMPFALVYLFYVILHGHLSPGGGFQGGVLMVAVVVLLYLGHGYETTTSALSFNFMHKFEGFASICYVAFAMLGVAYLGNFCYNAFAHEGGIGDLWSTGTIFLMNSAVGAKVLTGVGVLGLSMVGLLVARDGEE